MYHLVVFMLKNNKWCANLYKIFLWSVHDYYFHDVYGSLQYTAKRLHFICVDITTVDQNKKCSLCTNEWDIWNDFNFSLLFWTDCGEIPKIERSSLSGTDRQVIVRSALNRPKSITVDLHQDRLLWTDYEDGTVNSVNLLGQSRRRHVTKNGAQFYGISIHQVCSTNEF